MTINNDPHSPNYEIFINNIRMNDTFMKLITDVEVIDNAVLISSITFNIKYQQSVIGGLSNDLRDMKFISPGNLVVVRGGYGNNLNDLGAGYIVEIEPDYPENGEPTIKITCYDQLHKLSTNKSEKGESFKNFRDSQIASILGERNGFYIRSSNSSTFQGIRRTKGKKTRVLKRGATDLDLLKQLAKLNSYDLYCKWDGKRKRFGLYFEPPKDRTKDIMIYVYGEGNTPYNMTDQGGILVGVLKNFKPTFSIASQFTKYKVFSYDKKSERKISYTLSMDEFMVGQEDLKMGGARAEKLLKKNAATSGAGVRNKAFGTNTETISKKQFTNEDEAKEYLIAHMKKLAREFITGSGKVNGNQYLQSRQIVTFNGLGSFFDGRYFLKQIRHKFSGNDYSGGITVRKAIREEV